MSSNLTWGTKEFLHYEVNEMSTSRVNSVFGKKQRRTKALARFTMDTEKMSDEKYVERKNVELKALKSRV